MSGYNSHTRHILAKVSSSHSCALTFPLQKQHFAQALFQIWYRFIHFIFFLILFFVRLYFGLCVFWRNEAKKERKKTIQTGEKVKWWQLCILRHNPVRVTTITQKKKPLSRQLFSAIRCAVSLGVESGLFSLYNRWKKYHPGNKKMCKLFLLRNGMFFVNQHYCGGFL